MLLKRILMLSALVLVFALPARAEVIGVYGGLKFIDAIQGTGAISKSNLGGQALGFNGLGVDSYSQNTVGGGVFLGYDFSPKFQTPVRVELEYAIRTNMGTEWSVTHPLFPASHNIKAEWNLQTLFANVYLDFHNSTAFTPYIGGGLGMGFIHNSYKAEFPLLAQLGMDPEYISKSKLNTVFAWNFGAGCSYAFTENFSLDLAYRFVGLGYNEMSATAWGEKVKIGTSPYAHEFSLGARFTF
ncbi:MAG: outer membrane beta-barrel protein [Deltaproteobacteria bacterium]|jgi:opacity protein-like surface antigen|nr:outer membrane beta-barrel protein [Deltaproteobacteria bacterium]